MNWRGKWLHTYAKPGDQHRDIFFRDRGWARIAIHRRRRRRAKVSHGSQFIWLRKRWCCRLFCYRAWNGGVSINIYKYIFLCLILLSKHIGKDFHGS